MRPLSLRMRGLTRFTQEVSLDLRGLPPGIIAFTGPNGAGKSTLLDALTAIPVYQTMGGKRSGKPLKDWCNGPTEIDAVIEHNGVEYRHLLQIDPNAAGGRGLTKAYLYRDGTPLGEGGTDGGVNAYKAACGRIYPTQEVFFASAYAAQNRAGSFMALDQAERKELFAQLLGLGHLAELAEKAGDKRKPLDAEAARFGAEASTIAELRASVTTLQAALIAAEATLPAAQARVTDAERVHTATVQAEADARAMLTRIENEQRVTRERRSALERQIRQAAESSQDTTTLLERIALFDARRADIEDRAAQLAAAKVALQTATAERRTREAELRTVTAQMERGRADYAALLKRRKDAVILADTLPELEQEAAGLRARLIDQAEVRARLDAIPPVNVAAARDAVTRARKAAFAIEGGIMLRDEAIRSAEHTAGLVDGVPCGGKVLHEVLADPDPTSPESGPSHDCGTCQFLADANKAHASLPVWREEREQLRADLAAAQEHERAMQQALLDADLRNDERAQLAQRVTEQERDADRLAGVMTRTEAATIARDACPEIYSAIEQMDRAIADAEIAVDTAKTAADNAAALDLRASRAVSDIAGAEGELRNLEAALAKRPLLDAALADVRTRIADLTAQQAALPPIAMDATADAQRAVDRASEQEEDARGRLRGARMTLRAEEEAAATLRGRIAGLGDPEAKQADLDSRRADVGIRRSGYVLLENALGVNGVPALLIDHAAPEISRLVGDILGACAGGRFSVALKTIQEAGGGRKQLERLDLQILDGDRGAPRSVQALSGGEEVLIGAALRAALCAFMARRTGGIGAAQFDELDAGLRGPWLAAFPDLLRSARVLGGFHHLFYVPLAPELAEQADARIVCEGGRAWIE